MSLYIEASVGPIPVGEIEILNVTPCEHMHRSSCECICAYKVLHDGKRVGKRVGHRRDEPWWKLLQLALEQLP